MYVVDNCTKSLGKNIRGDKNVTPLRQLDANGVVNEIDNTIK